MKERITRNGDETLYQPKIHSDRIRELYAIKLVTGLPMTVLLDYAIRDLRAKYLANQEQEVTKKYQLTMAAQNEK